MIVKMISAFNSKYSLAEIPEEVEIPEPNAEAGMCTKEDDMTIGSYMCMIETIFSSLVRFCEGICGVIQLKSRHKASKYSMFKVQTNYRLYMTCPENNRKIKPIFRFQ